MLRSTWIGQCASTAWYSSFGLERNTGIRITVFVNGEEQIGKHRETIIAVLDVLASKDQVSLDIVDYFARIGATVEGGDKLRVDIQRKTLFPRTDRALEDWLQGLLE